MDRTLVIALTVVAALLPFERVGSFDLGGFNLRPSQLALAVAWIVFLRAWRGGLKIKWRQPAFLALAAFFAAAGLSLLNAENLRRSLIVLAFTLFTASLAFLLPQALRRDEDFARVRKVILISAALVGVFGLWQFVGDMLGAPLWLTGLRETYSRAILGFTRVQATAAEPLYFADYLLLPIALTGAWLLRDPDRRTTRFLTLALGIMLIDVFLTSSRGGWLGLGVTAVTLIWLERRRLAWPQITTAVGFCVITVAAGVFLLNGFFSTTRASVAETFFKHVTTIFDGAAFTDRLQTFSGAITAWQRHPWLGVGFGGYGPFVSTYALVRPDSGWVIVNNETLELLAETGVIGLTAFVIFLIIIFLETSRRYGQRRDVPLRYPLVSERDVPRAVRIAATAALLGMLAQYQTFSTLYIMHVWFTIGLLIAASESDRT